MALTEERLLCRIVDQVVDGASGPRVPVESSVQAGHSLSSCSAGAYRNGQRLLMSLGARREAWGEA